MSHTNSGRSISLAGGKNKLATLGTVTPPPIKVMFWNIQNIYGFKIMTKGEFDIEKRITGGGERKKNLAKFTKKNVAHMGETFEGSDPEVQKHKREWVVEVIKAVDPDVVAIVELSIGGKDLQNFAEAADASNQMQLATDKKSYKYGEGAVQQKTYDFDETNTIDLNVEHGGGAWAMNQYMVDLNKAYARRMGYYPWESMISNVCTTGLVGDWNESTGGLRLKKGPKGTKNTMFELYGLLWKWRRLQPDPREIRTIHRDTNNNVLQFPERAPGFVNFVNPVDGAPMFGLIYIHSAFGDSPTSTDFKDRGLAIEQLAKVKQVVAGGPMVIAGDFNLDFVKYVSAYAPLEKLGYIPMIHGKTSLTAKGETYLASAYDNIFWRGFASCQSKVCDFVAACFGGDIKKAMNISDHLPVFATIHQKVKPPQPIQVEQIQLEPMQVEPVQEDRRTGKKRKRKSNSESTA